MKKREAPGPGPLEARSYWIVGPGRGELRTEVLEEVPKPDEAKEDEEPHGETALVRTWYSGLSRGTERLVHQGKVPPSERLRMRAPFQKGDFPFPVKYGYMAVGRVEEGPEGVLGKAVFCLHPHQDLFQAPVQALIPIPERDAGSRALPLQRAVLAANMETAINIVWDARPSIGDGVAVVGAGVVGCLVAYLCAKIPGVAVTLIDVQASRSALAETFGARFLHAPGAASAEHLGAFDLVIHTSGSHAGLADALRLAATEARVVEASWYGEGDVPAPLGGAFHSQRLELRSSQVGRIPPHQAPRWNYRRRLELALSLLDDPALDALITSIDPFDDISLSAPHRISAPDTLCAVFAYPPALRASNP